MCGVSHAPLPVDLKPRLLLKLILYLADHGPSCAPFELVEELHGVVAIFRICQVHTTSLQYVTCVEACWYVIWIGHSNAHHMLRRCKDDGLIIKLIFVLHCR